MGTRGASDYEAGKGLLIVSAGDVQQLVGECLVCFVSAEAVQSVRTPERLGDAGEDSSHSQLTKSDTEGNLGLYRRALLTLIHFA